MFVLTGGFRGDCENQVTVILEKNRILGFHVYDMHGAVSGRLS